MTLRRLLLGSILALGTSIPAVADQSGKNLNELVTDNQWLLSPDIVGLSEAVKGDLLSYFANIDDEAKLTTLLGAGITVDTKNTDGTTALFVAVGSGSINSINVLLAAGANPLASTSRGTPKQQAELTANPIVQALLEGRDLTVAEQLRLAARSGDVAVIDSLLKSNANVKEMSDGGVGALLEAVVAGNAQIAKILLDAGADPEAKSRDGMTPMSAAIAAGDLEIVALLLKNGVSPNGTAFDMPLLSIAVATRQEGILDALLAAGADPNIPSAQGMRPADLANSMRMTAIVEKLGGITKPKKKPNLMVAVQENDFHEVSQALTEGASPNIELPDGLPLLLYAVAYSSPAIVSELVNAGADVLKKGPGEATVLHAAFVNQHKGTQFQIILSILKAAREAKNKSTPINLVKSKDTSGRSGLVLLAANSTGDKWSLEPSYRKFFYTLLDDPEVAPLINLSDADGLSPFKAAVLSGNVFLGRLFGLAKARDSGDFKPQDLARARQDWAMLAALPSDRELPLGISRGAQLEAKKELQSRLRDWGYYHGDIDGSFGSGSRAALKSFFADREKELRAMAPFHPNMHIFKNDEAESGRRSFELWLDQASCRWSVVEWSQAKGGTASKFVGCSKGDDNSTNSAGIALIEYSDGRGWAIELIGPGGWPDDRSEL